MKVKYIRRDIPEEISEAGGAYIQLVGKSTVGLAASVKEAIRSLHCVGEASPGLTYQNAIPPRWRELNRVSPAVSPGGLIAFSARRCYTAHDF